MKRTLILSFLITFSALSRAADIPRNVIESNESNLKMCIQRATNDCIATVCPNSSELDCDSTCQKEAENKCTSMQQ